MKLSALNEWLTLAANVGVFAGIIFLAIEIRTNTQTNIIGIQETLAASSNQTNSLLVTREIAEIVEKAANGGELSGVEFRQLRGVINTYATRANFTRRLYERGIASEEDLRNGHRALRIMAQEIDIVRQEFETRSEPGRSMILDDDGIDRYIETNR